MSDTLELPAQAQELGIDPALFAAPDGTRNVGFTMIWGRPYVWREVPAWGPTRLVSVKVTP